MERSASQDDLVACPRCRSRLRLTIRWLPDLDHRVHERTEVGCAACEIWFSAQEDRWAFAEWNVWACNEWERQGDRQPHADLYRLLLEEAHLERAKSAAGDAVSRYLVEHVVPTCPWKPGDRFESLDRPTGTWSAIGVEAVYGTNTGPFWIVKARDVLPSGKLGDRSHEFWQHLYQLHPCPRYWEARLWDHVHEGDDCILSGRSGCIMHVDRRLRRAIIRIGADEVAIRRPHGLRVPTVHVESGST